PRRGRALRSGAVAVRAAEHQEVIRDDLGRPAIVAVAVLPLASAELALDEDLRALAQVLGSDLGQPAEHRDVVPLGALLLLAGLPVLPGLGGREANVRDGAPARHVARLGIGAETADELDFVQAAHYASLSTLPGKRAPTRCK